MLGQMVISSMKKNSWAVVREGLSRKVTFKCRLGRSEKVNSTRLSGEECSRLKEQVQTRKAQRVVQKL